MTNIELAGTMVAPRLVGPTVDDWQNEPLSWHAEQQQLRFGKKPYKVQFQDASFADLDARNIEYEANPLEEAFDAVTGVSDPYHNYELDDPWYFSEKIQPQLPFFEQLDAEQKLHLLQEPEQFTIEEIDDGEIRRRIAAFLTEAVTRDEYWSTVDPNDVLEYYYHRKRQLETSGNQRLQNLRGEQND